MGGMKLALYFAALLMIFQLATGCDEPAKSADPVVKVSRLPLPHRFVNVSSTNSPGVALDTETGQYCRTWDWTYKSSSLNGSLDTLPTCLSIFQGTPPNSKDPLGVLGPQK